ncbi:unnamed protein product [Rhizoctonia solani]|uniref:Uncharacterized protein n=1 Tax=Rhizoctonia solani TaxID=456999 RepID=A0A8H3GD05_9AGAM|nr:unnamed protein product [Rhizoctonia solani]
MTETTGQDSRPIDDREKRGRSRSIERDTYRRSRSPDRRSRSRSRDRRARSKSPRRETTHRASHRSRSPRRHRDRSRSKSRSRSRSPRRHRASSRSRDKRRRSRSRSRSVSSRSSASDSDSSRERRRRRKRHDKEERRREKKERKKEKRERKEKKKHKGKTGAVTGQWGQHGIINESHMYEKDAEFRTWLVEECKINPESLSKDATRKQFARFVEDYNTATLPHPKFYNMASYERQMNSLRNGMTADVIGDSYDLSADLAAHTSRHKRPTAESETHLSREQLQELRKVQMERVQAGKMKLLGMEIKGTMGVRMDGTEFE